jgi:predicted O-linked N-acetylglucosamine transferase (SPINDLY family)
MGQFIAERLQQAVDWHARGELARAAEIYQELIGIDPAQPDALHLLGVVLTQSGRFAPGAALIERSLAVNPDQPVATANLGHALMAMNRADAALSAYERSLAMRPDNAAAHNGRGSALAALGRLPESLESFDRALQLAPDFLEARNNRGVALRKLGRSEEAMRIFDGVLAARPDDAKALANRAAARYECGRFAEALADCDRALAGSPQLIEAHRVRCSAYRALRRLEEALAESGAILAIAPNDAEALVLRGNVLRELEDSDAARAAYRDALAIEPDHADALLMLGALEMAEKRFDAAAHAFKRLNQLAAERDFVAGALLHAQLHSFDWSDYADSRQRILDALDAGKKPDQPLPFLALSDDPERQRQCARRLQQQYDRSTMPVQPRVQPRGGAPRERVRVAYVSADFLEHPMAYLLAGVFEMHDRARFEVLAISLRSDPASPTAERLGRAFERFIDVSGRSDQEVAGLIRDLDVDIAVDLMGCTAEERPGILRGRPAPVQVNYIGYPGTMGARHIDYLIADRFVIPPDSARFYEESVVYMPDCFQPNDANRVPPAKGASRRDEGLPESEFVWCTFHGSFKINPPLFDVWARLMTAVPRSVLWLVASSALAEANLRREAQARGVDPRRLIFAKRVPYPRHLARLGLADLCLDTWPFNGGATTSDALWMGVPVVTCVGRAFASRMSGSLLTTLGLPELVTRSFGDYEALALRLATHPEELAAVRLRLEHARASSPLYATDRYRRYLEAAFSIMADRSRSGAAPQGFSVPA